MAVSRDSIHKLTLKTAAAIRKSLTARGITVTEVDGPSADDATLRGLQELQAIAQGLDEADAVDAARTSTVGTTSASTGSTSGIRTDNSVGSMGDASTPGTGKK